MQTWEEIYCRSDKCSCHSDKHWIRVGSTQMFPLDKEALKIMNRDVWKCTHSALVLLMRYQKNKYFVVSHKWVRSKQMSERQFTVRWKWNQKQRRRNGMIKGLCHFEKWQIKICSPGGFSNEAIRTCYPS